MTNLKSVSQYTIMTSPTVSSIRPVLTPAFGERYISLIERPDIPTSLLIRLRDGTENLARRLTLDPMSLFRNPQDPAQRILHHSVTELTKALDGQNVFPFLLSALKDISDLLSNPGNLSISADDLKHSEEGRSILSTPHPGVISYSHAQAKAVVIRSVVHQEIRDLFKALKGFRDGNAPLEDLTTSLTSPSDPKPILSASLFLGRAIIGLADIISNLPHADEKQKGNSRILIHNINRDQQAEMEESFFAKFSSLTERKDTEDQLL